MNIEEQHR